MAGDLDAEVMTEVPAEWAGDNVDGGWCCCCECDRSASEPECDGVDELAFVIGCCDNGGAGESGLTDGGASSWSWSWARCSASGSASIWILSMVPQYPRNPTNDKSVGSGTASFRC